MGEYNQICDHCQDVISSVKDDTVRIQRGYFNTFGDFIFAGKSEVRHARCHNLIEAKALVMGEITAHLKKDLEL